MQRDQRSGVPALKSWGRDGCPEACARDLPSGIPQGDLGGCGAYPHRAERASCSLLDPFAVLIDSFGDFMNCFFRLPIIALHHYEGEIP